MEILEKDIIFWDSPEAGNPNCFCSRCANLIQEGELPIRIMIKPETPEEIAQYGTDTWEYRFCEKCQYNAGYRLLPFEVRTCRICGCTDDDCRQCIEASGEPCHWVEADLCSRCVQKNKRLVLIESTTRSGQIWLQREYKRLMHSGSDAADALEYFVKTTYGLRRPQPALLEIWNWMDQYKRQSPGASKRRIRNAAKKKFGKSSIPKKYRYHVHH